MLNRFNTICLYYTLIYNTIVNKYTVPMRKVGKVIVPVIAI